MGKGLGSVPDHLPKPIFGGPPGGPPAKTPPRPTNGVCRGVADEEKTVNRVDNINVI